MSILHKLVSNAITDRNEAVYYLTQFLHSLMFTIPIWIVYYQARISVAEISLLMTAQYLSQMVMELPSGALADMIGRKQTTLLAFLIGGISFLLFPRATDFWHFLVLVLLVGVSDSFRSGSEEALMYDTYKQAGDESGFTKTYANGNLIYQAGLIIATALGGFIYESNQHLPYTLYGGLLLLGALLASRYIEPAIDSETFTLKNYLSQIVTGSKEAFKNTYTKYISLFYIFVGGIAWSSTLYFNDYMMVDLGFGDSARGYIGAGTRLINAILVATVLKNSKLFGRRRTIMFFPVIMLLGYLPGIWLSGYVGVPFIQAAMIATTARWVILSPLTNQAFSSKYRATAISLLSLLIGFVYVALTSVSTVIIPTYGIKTMYSLLGVVTLVSVVPLSLRLYTLKRPLAKVD